MWSPSYGCFSTGMHDDPAHINRLALAGSAVRLLRPCSILPTALNNHAGKHLV